MRQRSRPSPETPSGFSLVELLIVVGIMALLISILLPSIARAKDAARRIACASNLRQLNVATQVYLNDYRGYLPVPGMDLEDAFVLHLPEDAGKLWYNALPLALGQKPLGLAGRVPWLDPDPHGQASVFACPAARTISDQRRTYAMNANLTQGQFVFWAAANGVHWPGLTGHNTPIKPDFLRNKTYHTASDPDSSGSAFGWQDVPYLMDGPFDRDSLATWFYTEQRQMGLFNAFKPQNDRAQSNPHAAGMNVLFLDGHVGYCGSGHLLYRGCVWIESSRKLGGFAW